MKEESMQSQFRLGIQSYCFRIYKTLDTLIDALKQAELPYVEIWPGHINYAQEPETIKQALTTLKEHGITIDAYGGINIKNDEEEARQMFAFAKMAGIQAMTLVHIEEEVIPLAERLCEEYDINLALHNHGRNHWIGRFDQLHALLAKTSQRFGVCIDTAWFLDADEDPVQAIDEFKDRVYGVHLKDFVFDAEGKHQDVIIGTGGLDLPVFMKRLRDIGYNGYLALEYEGDEHDPIPSTLECVKAVRKVIAEL
jgi:sugar phosphate isomerase/epimerase